MASIETDHWIDKQGDVWALGSDGLMHTAETAPFPREYVEKKWGPLREQGRKVVAGELIGTSGSGTVRCAHMELRTKE